MSTQTTLENLPTLVGQALPPSDWLTIDQDRVNLFADATGDHQWIHVDVPRATAEIGGPIAHGFLTLSLIPFLGKDIVKVSGVSRGINYGLNKVRFTNMVKVGARVRAVQKILSAEAKAGGVMLTSEITIEIDGEARPACVAETVSLLFP
jgi:acyl dehydratase